MSSIAHSSVAIQASPQSVPSTPSWFGEVTIIAHYLRRLGILFAIQDRSEAPGVGRLEPSCASTSMHPAPGQPTCGRAGGATRADPTSSPTAGLFSRLRVPISDSAGLNIWLAMPARQLRLLSKSPCSG